MTPIILIFASLFLICGGLLIIALKDGHTSLLAAVVATLSAISAISLFIYSIITGVTI